MIALFGDAVKSLARDMAQQIIDDVKLRARLVKEHDDEILRQLNRAIDAQPSLELLETRATILYRQDRVAEALADLDTILTHCPGDLMTLYSRANVYESQRQYAKAVEDLRRLRTRANELPRDLRHKVMLQLGSCLLRLKQMKPAATSFDEALRLAPNSLNAVLGRLEAGLALKTLGSQREQDLLKQAIATWPHMSVFDPLIEAGGLGDELAEERGRYVKNSPAKTPPIQEHTQGGGWLVGATAASVALLATAMLVMWWMNSSDADSTMTVVSVPSMPEAPAAPPPIQETTDVTATPPPETAAPTMDVAPLTAEPTKDVAAAPAVDGASSSDSTVAGAEPPTAAEPVEEPAEEDIQEENPPAPEAEVREPEPEPIAEQEEPERPAKVITEPAPKKRRESPQPKPAEPKLVKIPSVKNSGLRSPRVTDESEWVESRLRKIALAMHNYADVNRTFPVKESPQWFDEENQPYLSWRVHLLPFLDESTLHKQFRLDEPWDSPHNARLLKYMPSVYQSAPSDEELTRFVTAIGDHTLFQGNRRTFASVIDGTQNTILVLQGPAAEAQPWTKPTDLLVDMERPGRAWGRSPRGIYCVMADGRPLHLPGSIPDKLFSALLTARGNEALDGQTVRRFAAHRRRRNVCHPRSRRSPRNAATQRDRPGATQLS